MKLNCKNCGAPLEAPAERTEGDWFIRCFCCGAKNVIQSVLEVVGWRA